MVFLMRWLWVIRMNKQISSLNVGDPYLVSWRCGREEDGERENSHPLPDQAIWDISLLPSAWDLHHWLLWASGPWNPAITTPSASWNLRLPSHRLWDFSASTALWTIPLSLSFHCAPLENSHALYVWEWRYCSSLAFLSPVLLNIILGTEYLVFFPFVHFK